MKHRIRFLLFIIVFIFASGKWAVAQPGAISAKVYQAALEEEFEKYGASRFLYYNADSYERLIRYKIEKRLGLNFIQDLSGKELTTENTSIDTISKDITSKTNGDQDETTIAISRMNPKIIVAGANDLPAMNTGMPAYYTLDGGNNWATARIKVPRINGVNAIIMGDPALAADDSGNFYYAYLAGASGTNENNLIVATSKDAKTWTNGGFIVPPDSVAGFEDKENIWVDQNHASPYYGRVYVVWVHFNDLSGQFGGGGRISWSDDKCKTWSIPKHITDSLIKFAEVRTGKNGEVFFSFSIVDPGSQVGSHLFLYSTDGGESFRMNSFSDFTLYPPRSYDSRPALKGTEGFRAYPYIAHDVDLKTNRIHLVYGSWYDDGSGVNLPAAVLYYISSTDLGNTWTIPLALGISNPNFNTLDRDRFCPWVSVNQKNGDAYCSYYSSERDPNNALIAAFRTKLTNTLNDYPHPLEQTDFDPTVLTKAQSYPGRTIAFIGDYYQGSDSYDSTYAAVWTQGATALRNDGDVYVYIETPSKPAGSGGVAQIIKSQNLWVSDPTPNPVSNHEISLSYYLPITSTTEISVYSIDGKKIITFAQEKLESGTYTKTYRLEELSSGAYILRISTGYGSVEKRLVIIK